MSGRSNLGAPPFQLTPCAPRFHRVRRVEAPARDVRAEVALRSPQDSVAVMLYARDAEAVVLLERFRAGAAAADPSSPGRVLETIAAAAPEGADAAQLADAARAAALDATGYEIARHEIEPVAAFYPSPGASAERVTLFYAEIAGALAAPTTHDQSADRAANNAIIRIAPVIDFFRYLEAFEDAPLSTASATEADLDFGALRDAPPPRGSVDAKLLVGAQELRRRLAARRRFGVKPPADFAALAAPHRFGIPELAPEIVLHRGDIGDVHGVDVWVNSENTDLEMDQRLSRSVSGRIRGLGCHVGGDLDPLEDTIWIDLQRQRRTLDACEIGATLETTPGELKRRNGVNRLIHVAAVEASAFGIRYARLIDVERCVISSLKRTDEGRRIALAKTYGRAVLFPMIGAGNSDQALPEIFALMLRAVHRYFKEARKSRIEAVHFVAYSDRDYASALRVLALTAGATPRGRFTTARR